MIAVKRFLALLGVAVVASALVGAATASLDMTAPMTPAQGSISVSGPCVSVVNLTYTYVRTDGITTTTLADGDAVYVSSIVVTRTSGPSACTGTRAAIAFANTANSAPLVGGVNPTYSSGSATWTFNLDTTGTDKSRNAIASWNPGSTITITVY